MISHKRLATWYLQIAQNLEAGMPVSEAILLAGGPPETGKAKLADSLIAGASLEEAMKVAPSWLPRSDRLLIGAAEQTGRLPQTFIALSKRHETIGATQMKVILGLTYPLAVLHIAALVLPLVSMIDYEIGFEWDLLLHLRYSLTILLPLWGMIALITLLAKTETTLLSYVLRCLPLLRSYSKKQSLADLAYSLGTFIETGVMISTAWKLSAQLCNDRNIQKAYSESIAPSLATGNDPGLSLKEHSVFPADFTSYYQNGARTGNLDTNLIKIGSIYQQQANRAMTLASITYPSLLLVATAGVIIFNIFAVFGDYVNFLMKLSES